MDISNLGDLAKQMQDAYSDGTDVMGKAGKEVAKDMKPDHEIELDIKLSAKVEGYDYLVDATITFEIEINPVLQSSGGDLSALLDGLDVDMGDDEDAIMQQLGQPRVIGVVKDIEVRNIILNNSEGRVKADLNREGTLLATVKGDEILVNCESVFSFPKLTDVFVAIPSMETMHGNIVIPLKDIEKKISFKWVEKDKNNLKVEGSIKFKAL
ncbi:hypothetical protein K8R20_02780 [bacterium]|nr:hypothetical protein [bacterium]